MGSVFALVYVAITGTVSALLFYAWGVPTPYAFALGPLWAVVAPWLAAWWLGGSDDVSVRQARLPEFVRGDN